MDPIIPLGILAYLAFQRSDKSSSKAPSSSSSSNLPGEALAFAKSQIGVTENPIGSNTDPNGVILGYMKDGCWDPAWGTGPWCAGFVSACWARTSQPIYFKTCTVSSLENFASQHGVWNRISSTSDFEKVIPGNFFTIDENSNGVSNHTGIIESYDASTKILHTIEGNYSNAVKRVARKSTLSKIVGFSTISSFISTKPCGG